MKFKITGPKVVYSYNMARQYDFFSTYYYDKTDEVVAHIVKRNEKTLFFVSSKEKGEKIQEDFEKAKIKAIFITADNREGEKESETVRSLTKFCKFQEKVLIATSVLDVGVNIKDDDVVNVVIEAYDRDTFLQMLGRIRQTDKSTGFNLFIRKWKVSDFNLRLADLERKLDFFQRLAGMSPEAFKSLITGMLLDDSERELLNHCLYFDGKYHINRLARYQDNICYHDLLDIVEGLKKDADYSVKKQLTWIGKEEEFSFQNFISDDVKAVKILEAAERLKELSKEFKTEVNKQEIEKFCEMAKPVIRDIDIKFVRKSDALSVKRFNEFTKTYNIPLEIQTIKYSRPQGYKVVSRKNDTAVAETAGKGG